MTIGFGLIGCGRIAARHADLLGDNHIANARVVAVCDSESGRADAMAQRLGVVAYHDIDRILADASVDAVLCVTMLCHQSIESPTAAIREFARVVRPGGIVCLWEPGVRRLRRAHDRVTHTGRRFSRLDLARCATDAGLDVIRSTGAHSYLVPPALVKAVLERGDVASDLDGHAGGLGGVLATAARAERAVLQRVDLPFGLSAITLARRPM